MTAQEPGGPGTQETTSNIFKRELATLKENWGINIEAVNAALATLKEKFTDAGEQTVHQLQTRAVQWYAAPKDDYREDLYFLEGATFHDEPLAMDGKGPWLTGEIVSIAAHEIPGEPGIGWGENGNSPRRIAPYVPGVMIANTQVQGDDVINERDLAFIPLLFMNEPDVRTLELVDDERS